MHRNLWSAERTRVFQSKDRIRSLNCLRDNLRLCKTPHNAQLCVFCFKMYQIGNIRDNELYWFLVNVQRDAQILFYVFISIYNSLHVSSTSCSSSGETNCINTTSGNSHSMLVAEMCAGWKKTHVFFQPAHISATNIEWLLPEAVLIQFVSPDDEHDVLETCREL